MHVLILCPGVVQSLGWTDDGQLLSVSYATGEFVLFQYCNNICVKFIDRYSSYTQYISVVKMYVKIVRI